ncbi:MAG: hypothetical protein RR293_07760 [Bacteroidales bacterium]
MVNINFKDASETLINCGQIKEKRYILISVPDAMNVLTRGFKYFLAKENKPYKYNPAYKEIAEWLSDNKGKGLIMEGECGLGKSLLGKLILPTILFHYCNKIVGVYDTNFLNANIDEVLKECIISLDDIGTEDVSVNYGNRRLAFAELMDEAEKTGKLVIISTNLTADEIASKYGERVRDRIRACCKRVTFKGKSNRG